MMQLWILIFTVLGISCVTQEKSEQLGTQCPSVTITVENGEVWTDADKAKLADIQAGCEHKYGPRACIVRVNKVRDRGYWVICRRDAK